MLQAPKIRRSNSIQSNYACESFSLKKQSNGAIILLIFLCFRVFAYQSNELNLLMYEMGAKIEW